MLGVLLEVSPVLLSLLPRGDELAELLLELANLAW
jgi:hypothetical protein